LAALRSDAATWDGAADGLNGPGSAVGGLALTPADISVYAADQGLDRTYHEACTKLGEVLKQASENFRNIAGALRESADTYQREDEQGMHRLKGIY
jgi:hypothetical protein